MGSIKNIKKYILSFFGKNQVDKLTCKQKDKVFGLILPKAQFEGIFPVVWKDCCVSECLYIVSDNKRIILEDTTNVYKINEYIFEENSPNDQHIYGYIDKNGNCLVGSKLFVFKELYLNNKINNTHPFNQLMVAKFFGFSIYYENLIKRTNYVWAEKGFLFKINLNHIVENVDNYNNINFTNVEEYSDRFITIIEYNSQPCIIYKDKLFTPKLINENSLVRNAIKLYFEVIYEKYSEKFAFTKNTFYFENDINLEGFKSDKSILEETEIEIKDIIELLVS